MSEHHDEPQRPALAVVPVGLRVDARRVVVVGAGRIAARKAAAYADQHAVITVVAPEHSPEMDAVFVDTRIRRSFVPKDLDGAWLVVAATGDPAVDGTVFAEAEKRRLWCNAADDPEHCSVILPAVSRKGDITISISTGGTSPATASWLRRRIDALLDEDTLAIASACARVRSEALALGLATEVPGWAQVLDDDVHRLVAEGGARALEDRLRDVVIGGQS